MGNFASHFARVFASLDRDSLHRLPEIYAGNVHFTDPLHDLHGLDALHGYCNNLYQNVTSLHFEFHQCSETGDAEAFLRWTMTFAHPRLRGGQDIQVPGCTFIRYDNQRVTRHIDYYDAGALLYEHVPVMGGAIRWLKGRLA